jgi:hypothetical protein
MVGGNPGREVAVSCSKGCSDGFRLDRAGISPATAHPIGCMVVKTGGGRAAMHQIKPNDGGSAMKVKEAMHKGVDWVSPITGVYRKLKLARSGDEVRPGWRVN